MSDQKIESLFEKYSSDGWSGDAACMGIDGFKSAVSELNLSVKYLDIVFDAPPGPESGRFVEVEDETGKSVCAGSWLESLDGYHKLRIHMPSDNADVQAFQEKFNLPMAPAPAFIDNVAGTFRIDFMREELNEFIEAVENRDLPKAADALVDLAYVVHGTALMMGLPWKQLWDEVQRANMAKARATHVSQSKRNSPLDVIKPPGWTQPDHNGALGHAPLTPTGAFSTFDTTTREFVK